MLRSSPLSILFASKARSVSCLTILFPSPYDSSMFFLSFSTVESSLRNFSISSFSTWLISSGFFFLCSFSVKLISSLILILSLLFSTSLLPSLFWRSSAILVTLEYLVLVTSAPETATLSATTNAGGTVTLSAVENTSTFIIITRIA